MAERPLSHSFSVRAVAREALADYGSRFVLLQMTAFAVFIPAGLIEVAVEDVLTHRLDFGANLPAAVTAAIGGALAVTLTATLGEVFYTGVVAAIVAHQRGGVRRGLADIARSLPYWRLIAVDVVFALLVGIGLVALIVPGVIALVWLCLAAPVVEIEDRGIGAALRRSRELVRGNFWRVLALVVPTVLLSGILAEWLSSAGHWLLGEGFLGEWLGNVVGEALTAPFFGLVVVVSAFHLIALQRGDPAEQRR